MGLNVGHLKVPARKLGHVAGGETGFGTEDGADHKNSLKTTGDRHLFVELG